MRPPGLVAWVTAHARWFRAELVRAGYWLRPFDMLADRRRWRWQPARRCGIDPRLGAALAQGLEEGRAAYLEWKAEHPEDAARWEALLAREEGRPG